MRDMLKESFSEMPDKMKKDIDNLVKSKLYENSDNSINKESNEMPLKDDQK